MCQGWQKTIWATSQTFYNALRNYARKCMSHTRNVFKKKGQILVLGFQNLQKLHKNQRTMYEIYSAMKESCLGGMSHTFTFMSHTFGCLLQGGPYQGNQVEGCSLWP